MTLTIILPSGEFLYHGKQVTFKSPCDSEGLTGLIVDGVTYDVVNAMGTPLVGNSFDVGAMVSVIFDMNDNKAYVQNADTNVYLEDKFKEKLDKSGGTMTGPLTLGGAPTQNMHAATKKYVDENRYSHPSTHSASIITETDKIKMMTDAERIKLEGIEDNANKYTHPSTHPASMITETDAIKMFSAEEREKLAGIEEQANNYTHPSTHPATMISGLADHLTALGYGKFASGSYVGDGNYSYTNKQAAYEALLDTKKCRVIELPFSPKILFLYGIQKGNWDNGKYDTYTYSRQKWILQGENGLVQSTTGTVGPSCYLINNQLRVLYQTCIGSNSNDTIYGENYYGYTYFWVIAG